MIVVPFVQGFLNPLTVGSLRTYDPKYMEIKDKELGYSKILKRLWHKSFIIVEHDVLPWDGAIESLKNCPNDWCSFNYYECDYQTHLEVIPPFGCVKFSDKLIFALKNIWDKPLGWRKLDGHLQKKAEEAGFKACHHTPHVEHLNENL